MAGGPKETRGAGRKPSSVPGRPGDDHSSRTPVARGLQRPTRELQAGHLQALPYLVLLRVGFSKPAVSPPPLVSSYLTFSPLPWANHGGLVSEALSLGLPPLGITQHPALWSSDFPPAAGELAGDHLACSAALWDPTLPGGTPPASHYFTAARVFGQWPDLPAGRPAGSFPAAHARLRGSRTFAIPVGLPARGPGGGVASPGRSR